jgi:hypothetical protein
MDVRSRRLIIRVGGPEHDARLAARTGAAFQDASRFAVIVGGA